MILRRLIYFPDRTPVGPAARYLPGARDVTLRTSDGLQLAAWYLPPAGKAAVVLVANGNGGNRSHRTPLAAALAGRGLGVLLFDYRGYGGNPGTPSEAGLAADVRAAYRYLVDEAEVPAGRVLFLGESLGTAVVAELATTHPPAGLVLRSPFTSLADVGRMHYPFLPVRLVLRDRFHTAAHIARVAAPVTVVYGSADTIVPPELSQAVAAAAQGTTRVIVVAGADHNDPALLDGGQLIDAVLDLAAG